MKAVRSCRIFLFCAALSLATGAWADTNLTDIWWNKLESGWGVTLTQERNGPIFAAIYGYDGIGKAAWLVGSMDPSTTTSVNGKGRSYSGNLYETSGGTVFTAASFNPASVTTTPVGTIAFEPENDSEGTLTYTYKGATVTKVIERYTVSTISGPAVNPAGTSLRAMSNTISNGQCSEAFPMNTRTSLGFRIAITSAQAGPPVWNFGQCDAGSTTTCPVSTPVCSFTPKNSWQKGSSMEMNGDLVCTVGGAANPFSGGKIGKFEAGISEIKLDDGGYSAKMVVTDESNCGNVSTIQIKYMAWINSCSFSAGQLICAN